MTQTTRIITELCRHELLRERRSFYFSRNILIWCLYVLMWVLVSTSLMKLFQEYSMPYAQCVFVLLFADYMLRWFTQKTPSYNILQYKTLPVRRWQYGVWYGVRLLFLPINFIWLPVVWGDCMLMGMIVLNGYVYALCWHVYLALSRKAVFLSLLSVRGSSLLMCDLKLRFRHPALRQKMRNGLAASVVMILLSTWLGQQYYTDFAVIYTLTFPTLPLLSARLGYEQKYMPLLKTRMHGLVPVYLNKFMASLLMLMPSTVLLLYACAMGSLDAVRLLVYVLTVAFCIYPLLLCCAPRCEISSPSAQLVTLLTLTIPVAIINLIYNIL